MWGRVTKSSCQATLTSPPGWLSVNAARRRCRCWYGGRDAERGRHLRGLGCLGGGLTAQRSLQRRDLGFERVHLGLRVPWQALELLLRAQYLCLQVRCCVEVLATDQLYDFGKRAAALRNSLAFGFSLVAAFFVGWVVGL